MSSSSLTTHCSSKAVVSDADQEESVEQYVRRNLGKEVFERLVEPFCSGVYAGDPSKLSMTAAFGKVSWGILSCRQAKKKTSGQQHVF